MSLALHQDLMPCIDQVHGSRVSHSQAIIFLHEYMTLYSRIHSKSRLDDITQKIAIAPVPTRTHQ